MRPNVILYLTDNFDYADSNIALTENAFIDLFYAITRNTYPMSMQELGKTKKSGQMDFIMGKGNMNPMC